MCGGVCAGGGVWVVVCGWWCGVVVGGVVVGGVVVGGVVVVVASACMFTKNEVTNLRHCRENDVRIRFRLHEEKGANYFPI